MAETPTLTVAIPLHRGLRWAGNVLANIARLRGHAQMLVSDAHEHDNALSHVRARLGECDDVRFVGARDLPAGWVSHYNDLMRRATTPLMMWLPQDDEIDADWVVGGAETLRNAPEAILATGTLRAIDEEGCERAGLTIDRCPRLESPERDERVTAAVGYISSDWAPIGLPFRGVFRRDRAIAVPANTTDGEWADLLWALGMVARGPFAATPGAVYGKRFYGSSEHRRWSSFARSPDAIPLIEEVLLADGGPADRLPLLMAAWSGDRAALVDLLAHTDDVLAKTGRAAAERADLIAALEHEAGELRSALAREAAMRRQSETRLTDARAALAREAALRRQSETRLTDARAALATVLSSRSWRLTEPVRRLAAIGRTRGPRQPG